MMQSKSVFMPMFIMGTLFFIFGFVTWLNGSLIPFLKVLCSLNDFEALFVSFAFYIAYTVMAYPMALVLEKTGYRDGMRLGLLIMALGSLLFIPAAFSGEFFIFLVALFTLGTGLTLLQTASNPYIVLLGPIESAAMRISIMGLINKSAGVFAPLVFTALIFADMGTPSEALTQVQIDKLALNLVDPYIVMAIVLSGLTLLIKYSSLEELEFINDPYDDDSIFTFPRVILGAIALFFYVGVEVIAGDTIGLYAQDIGLSDVTSLTSYTMAFMVVAYVVGVLMIPKYLSQESALKASAVLGVLFTLGIVFSSQTEYNILPILPDSLLFVALLGLANALVWPTIWPLALEDLGKHTAKASALLIMAIAGGALLPLLFGKIAEISGDMQGSYIYLIFAYLIIFFYGVKGHKMKEWRA